MTYNVPKVTYSDPKATYCDPKVTHIVTLNTSLTSTSVAYYSQAQGKSFKTCQ